MLSLNNKNRAELRNKYSAVELVIINEISMASRKLMYEIYKRLKEIFSPSKNIPSGRKLILLCEGFYQLLPVQAKPLFKCDGASTPKAFVSGDLWLNFKLAELAQVMC